MQQFGTQSGNMTRQKRLAQMLMQQEQNAGPVQSHSQGLASVFRNFLAGQNMRADDANLQAAQAAAATAIDPQTPPLAPGVAGPPAPAVNPYGTRRNLMADLAKSGNPYAAQFLPQIAQASEAYQLGQQQNDRAFEQQKQLAALKRFPVPGRDVPFAPEVATQLANIAGAKAAAVPPSGYQPSQNGGVQPIPGGPQDPATIAAIEAQKEAAKTAAANAKPLPTSALKVQDDLIGQIGLAKGIAADMASIGTMLDNKDIELGMLDNWMSGAKNYVGASDKQSRNFATFNSTLEKMRNDSLRLNNGVQTEGDAQRAWKELFTNINDQEYVKQRLKEIQAINERAVSLKQYQVDTLRNNYGKGPLDEMPAISAAPGAGNYGSVGIASPQPQAPKVMRFDAQGNIIQ